MALVNENSILEHTLGLSRIPGGGKRAAQASPAEDGWGQGQ